MFIVLIRTIILYSLVILVMRLMGKRQIGELQPYEFVITIMISDLAALPMQDTRLPLILGIIPIITLLFIKTILTQLQLKSQLARKILEGEPVILVHKGKINMKALSKQQINLDELMEELRLAGYFDLNEIEYAILENNGQLSFLTSSSSTSSSSSPSPIVNVQAILNLLVIVLVKEMVSLQILKSISHLVKIIKVPVALHQDCLLYTFLMAILIIIH